MDREELFSELESFLKDVENPQLHTDQDLSEILYTMGERSLFIDDVDSVSLEQAILCWKIVEKLRQSNLPECLKM